MKIVIVSPLAIAVPPVKYGGAERIVYEITEGLIKKGHQVVLFASGDSKTSAKLISVTEKSLFERNIPFENRFFDLIEIVRAIEFAWKNKFDIIHSHLYDTGLAFSRISPVPLIHTTHGNTDPDYLPEGRSDIVKEFKDAYCVAISNYQKKTSPLNYVARVYNGIDINQLSFNPKGGDDLVWLGRFDPKKGALESIKVAKKIKMRLVLAGRLDRAVERCLHYYQSHISPEFQKGKIDYIGEVDLKQKNELLGNALALLNPISWDEPFGLVMIEAMACGTPVIAFNRGSVPEIIKDGETGFICPPGDIDCMEKKVKEIYEMPEDKYRQMRFACRRHVEENFTVEKMVDGYERVYEKVIDDFKSRNPKP